MEKQRQKHASAKRCTFSVGQIDNGKIGYDYEEEEEDLWLMTEQKSNATNGAKFHMEGFSRGRYEEKKEKKVWSHRTNRFDSN